MERQNETFRFSTQPIIYTAATISLNFENLNNKRILDFITVSDWPNLVVGYIIEGSGLLICNFKDQEVYSVEYHTIECNSTNSQFYNIPSARAFHYNSIDDYHLFIAMSLPPGVVEMNIRNPQMPFIQKIYKDTQKLHKFIGLPTVASNNNYIAQAMMDVTMNRQVIRVFDRNGTFLNMAKYDLFMRRDSTTNYMIFPNFFLNLFIYRDEHHINITALEDNQIVINATNSTMIQKYKYQTIQVKLNYSNQYDSQMEIFNITFLEKNNKTIRSSVPNNKAFEVPILYNCGDNEFEYKIMNYFSGPFFQVVQTNKTENCDDGSCFFEFQNMKFESVAQSDLNFSSCYYNFIFPFIETDNDKINDRIILICIDTEHSIISSSTICSTCEDKIIETNAIVFPETTLLHFGQDPENSLLFILATSNNTMIEDQGQIHYFKIKNTLMWIKSEEPTFQSILNFHEIQSFYYNPLRNTGVMVGLKSNLSQPILFFSIYEEHLELKVQIEDSFNIWESGVIWKALVANSNFIYTLSEIYDGTFRIKVFEARQGTSSGVFQMWEVVPSSETITDFDIFNDQYMVFFMGNNHMEVWEVSMNIYLKFKMKLPLYDEYSTYQYLRTRDLSRKIIRSFAYNHLAIVMYNELPDSNYDYYLFIYSLTDSQHSSLIMTQNITPVFANTFYHSVIMKGQNRDYDFAVLTDYKFYLYRVAFYNALQITQNQEFREFLVANCSQALPLINAQGNFEDNPVLISEQNINAISIFNESDNCRDRPITLLIFTQNQGHSIMPADLSQPNVSFSNEMPQYRNGDLILENFVQGHNLDFKYNCTFHSEDGEIIDCISGIQDQSQSEPFFFSLSFVTTQTQVWKSISMEQLFIMFDNGYNLYFMKLPKKQQSQTSNTNLDPFHNQPINLTAINNYPLEILEKLDQYSSMGCYISKFIKAFYIYRLDNVERPHAKYLIVYHCEDFSSDTYLKVAILKVYDQKTSENSTLYDFEIYTQYTQIANNIIDIELVKIDIALEDFISVTIAITSSIDYSSSNLFQVFNLFIDSETQEALFELVEQISAEIIEADTFKVTQLLKIPKSDILVVVREDCGIFFYDSLQSKILRLEDFKYTDEFYETIASQQGPLKVFKVIGDYPFILHVITNHGIYVLEYGIDLQNRTAVVADEFSLIPTSLRIIRYQFDQVNQDTASNKYGYAFLTTKQTSRDGFIVSLGVVSFYSGFNSKIFKIIPVSKNQQCMSLNNEPYLSSSEEDQLTVSFICNTRMTIIRICMRPHITIDMFKFNEISTRKLLNGDSQPIYNPGLMQFNQFEIQLYARNQFSNFTTSIKVPIKINLEFEVTQNSFQELCQWITTFNFLFLAIFTILAVLEVIIIQRNPKSSEGGNKKKRIRNDDDMWTFIEEPHCENAEEDYGCETVDWVEIKRRERIMDSTQLQDDNSKVIKEIIGDGICLQKAKQKSKETTHHSGNFGDSISAFENIDLSLLDRKVTATFHHKKPK